MRRIRVYIPSAPAGAVLMLPPEQAHHVRDVMRLRDGCGIEIIDAGGTSRNGVLVHVGADRVEVRIAPECNPTESPAPVTIAVALVKKSFDDTIRQLVELGVARVVPLAGARTLKGLAPRRERWARVAVEAQKQCGRAQGLIVESIRAVAEFAAEKPEGARFFGDAPTGSPLALLARDAQPPYIIAIGPEGGFTGEELSAFTAAGFLPARLGRFTLRTETAAVAAAAILAEASAGREASSPTSALPIIEGSVRSIEAPRLLGKP